MGFLDDSDSGEESLELSLSSLELDDGGHSPQKRVAAPIRRRRFDPNASVDSIKSVQEGTNEERLNSLLALKAALGGDAVDQLAREAHSQRGRALPGRTQSCDDTLTSMASKRRVGKKNKKNQGFCFQDVLDEDTKSAEDMMAKIRERRERKALLPEGKADSKERRTSDLFEEAREKQDEEAREVQRLKAKKMMKKRKSAARKAAAAATQEGGPSRSSISLSPVRSTQTPAMA